jgi:ADP-ribose pyrophosphatase YjhB (NUDIX family)
MQVTAMQFPSKRIAVGILIRDSDGRLLLVKPNYREGWLVPGGVVDTDESPRSGLIRELREELALAIEPGPLLCVDYVEAHGDYGDGLHLLFEGGCLAASVAQALQVCDPELQALQWVTPDEAECLLVPSLARRLQCLQQAEPNVLLYLEDGQLPNA